MTEIHTTYDIYVLGDVNTEQLMETLSEKAAEHGAVITETFAFPVGEPAEHSDLTEIDAVVEALGRAIATRTPLWLPFWLPDFSREEHLRRLSLTLQRHGVDLLVGPNLMACPHEGGMHEMDAALRSEIRLAYALDDAAMAAAGMYTLGAEIEAALAWAGQPAAAAAPKERLYSTTEVADLFGRPRGWLTQKLREGFFVDLDGSVIEPLRSKGGHRRYTRDMLMAMAWSARGRGALSPRCVKEVLAELDRSKR